jgi:hypothetical protein
VLYLAYACGYPSQYSDLVMGWVARVWFLSGEGVFLLAVTFRPTQGPPGLPSSVYWGPFPGHEADCSPSNARLRMCELVSTPPCIFIESCIISRGISSWHTAWLRTRATFYFLSYTDFNNDLLEYRLHHHLFSLLILLQPSSKNKFIDLIYTPNNFHVSFMNG